MSVSKISAAYTAPLSWSKASTVYNNNVGRTTAKATGPLIHLANSRCSLSSAYRRVIDLGTGTGSFALELARRYPDVPIVATDIAEGMLNELQLTWQQETQVDSKGLLSTRLLDMQDPIGGHDGEAEGSFSHAFNCFAIQMVMNPQRAVGGMYRLLRPGCGAVAAIAVWDFVRECAPHDIWDETARRVDPTYIPPPRNLTNDWQCMEDMEEKMLEAGFKDVKAEIFETEFDFQPHTVDGFLEFFFESKNPFPEERLRSFSNPDHGLLRETMRKVLEEREEKGKGFNLSLALAVGTRP